MQREGVSGGRPGRRGKRKKKRITILERKKKKKTSATMFPICHTHTQNATSTTWKVKSSLPPVLIFLGGEGNAGSLIDLIKVRKSRQPITLRNHISCK